MSWEKRCDFASEKTAFGLQVSGSSSYILLSHRSERVTFSSEDNEGIQLMTLLTLVRNTLMPKSPNWGTCITLSQYCDHNCLKLVQVALQFYTDRICPQYCQFAWICLTRSGSSPHFSIQIFSSQEWFQVTARDPQIWVWAAVLFPVLYRRGSLPTTRLMPAQEEWRCDLELARSTRALKHGIWQHGYLVISKALLISERFGGINSAIELNWWRIQH